MTALTLLNIVLLIGNGYLAYMHYELGNHKTSMFNAFVCGCVFTSLLDTFLNCA